MFHWKNNNSEMLILRPHQKTDNCWFYLLFSKYFLLNYKECPSSVFFFLLAKTKTKYDNQDHTGLWSYEEWGGPFCPQTEHENVKFIIFLCCQYSNPQSKINWADEPVNYQHQISHLSPDCLHVGNNSSTAPLQNNHSQLEGTEASFGGFFFFL